MKICSTCGRLLPDKEFTKGRSDCKYCRRVKDIKRRYGITDEEYIKMWKEQKGKCALCGKELEDAYLDVDHNHKTGKVRGLLCRGCNLQLDELFENNVTVGKLEEYLKEE